MDAAKIAHGYAGKRHYAKVDEFDYRKFFSASLDLLCIAGADGYFKDLSPSWSRTLGWSLEELKSKPFLEFVHPEDRDATYEIANQIIQGAKTVSFENRYCTKSGNYRTLVWSSQSIEGYFYAIARDVTEMRKHEEEVRLAHSLVQSIIDNIEAVIFVKDPQHRYLLVNNWYLKVSGMQGEQMLGKTDYELYPREIAERFVKTDKEVLKIKKTIRYEELFQKGNETLTYLTTKTPVFDKNGVCNGIAGIAMEITKSKFTQEELERSNKDLQAFAYVVSHDLIEPLRAIQSFSEILSNEIRPGLNEEQGQSLDFILKSTMRMKALVNDLLSFSRTTTSSAIKRKSVNFKALINDVILELKPQIENANAVIEVEDLPMMRVDKIQFRQVFQNIIANALKFRSQRRLRINVRCKKKSKQIECCIADNGIGIASQYLKDIFMNFRRLHTHDAYPGSGIGLAICKRIVERHGGQIWAQSILGKGTQIFFSLPSGPYDHPIDKANGPNRRF